MLDPKLLRNNLESVTQELLRRGFALDIDAVSYTHLTLPTNREV